MTSTKTAIKTAAKTTAKAATPAPRKIAARKPASSSAVLASPAPAVAQAKIGKTAKAAKTAKVHKLRTKPVRDSFTMPEADFALIATLKARAVAGQRETKKSELLRAGLHALAALESGALLAALEALEPVKIGRPRASAR